MKVIRRNDSITEFDKSKIINAILKAMNNCDFYSEVIANDIAEEIEMYFSEKQMNTILICDIEGQIYKILIEKNLLSVAKAYESYRAIQEYKRKINTTDESILSVLDNSNVDVLAENSNKDAYVLSTQRDLIAGESSKDIFMRKIATDSIINAINSNIYHYHDSDYSIQRMFNCCLVNLEDMLMNNTVINNKLVESPKSFETACTVATQIMAQVSSNQFGGQSITIKHLAPFLRRSYDKEYKYFMDKYGDEKLAIEESGCRMMKALKDGVQTIRYQLSTLMTTNG